MARSRGQLEEIIKRGEAVLLHDGRVVTKVEDLPSAVELAGDDIVKRQQAVADLEAAAQKALAELEEARAKTAAAQEEDTKRNEAQGEEKSATEAAAEFVTSDPSKSDDKKNAAVGRKAVEK